MSPKREQTGTPLPAAAWGTSVHVSGPTEEQVHLEHRAALEATLFRASQACDEVVLELDSGLLRLRATDR
jgi:hypothetical protein